MKGFHICHILPTFGPLLLETKINFHLTKATVNSDFLLYTAEPILPNISVYVTQSYPFGQRLNYNVKATGNTKDLFWDYVFRVYIFGNGKYC